MGRMLSLTLGVTSLGGSDVRVSAGRIAVIGSKVGSGDREAVAPVIVNRSPQ